MDSGRFKNSSGFSLLEIIVVLIIVAIVALVAVSAVFRQNANLPGRADALKSHIRYAQAMAMSTDDRNWGIRFHTGPSRYWLFYCDTGDTCSWGQNRTHMPGTDSDTETVELQKYNISIGSVSHGGNQVTLAFDNFGAPYRGGNNEVLENLLEDTFIITLADDSGRTEEIKVIPTTGAVP